MMEIHFTPEDHNLYQRLYHQDLPKVPPEVRVRRATADDYDAIMGFSEGVLDGNDYLPALYHKYLSNPLRFLFVAVVDDKVVSKPSLYKLLDFLTLFSIHRNLQLFTRVIIGHLNYYLSVGSTYQFAGFNHPCLYPFTIYNLRL